MKGSLTVVAFFCAGCLMGVANDFQFDLHDLSMYVLYALMFQVGIGIGSNKKLKELVKSLRPKMLLVPIATIVGTLLFSAFASLLLSQWSVFDCMAVGSGFAYYSLSSILITQLCSSLLTQDEHLSMEALHRKRKEMPLFDDHTAILIKTT